MIGGAEIRYPKEIYSMNKINTELNRMPMKEHWKVEETKKHYVLRFNPPKEKILKEFRKTTI